MKRINFNIKDRKVLTLGLCLVAICVFTLTIAYAALNAVLTIQGNAEVVASTWNIYLDNPRLSPGSEDIDEPTITGTNKVNFNTTLSQPGEFYEFVVDVVNAGDIDAMIASIIKTPDLTEEQAKFLKYEVTYENGTPITTQQTLSKGTTTPIKVRIEYRKDLNSTDLPTSQTVLYLSLTLEYTQSDGTGTVIPNNGVAALIIAGVSYKYSNGMTWGEWINSSYNTGGYIYEVEDNENSRIIPDSETCDIVTGKTTETSVAANEVIDPSQEYYLKHYNICFTG